MTVGPVHFTLDDGARLLVPADELRTIYDLLWDLAPEPGAISTAAVLLEAARARSGRRPSVELTDTQSTALRRAVDLLAAQQLPAGHDGGAHAAQ